MFRAQVVHSTQGDNHSFDLSNLFESLYLNIFFGEDLRVESGNADVLFHQTDTVGKHSHPR